MCERASQPLVVLEGSPEYYSRLGFEPAARFGITVHLPEWAPPEAAQVHRLTSYETSFTGSLVYPTYFRAG